MVIDNGNNTSGIANVDDKFNLQVITPGNDSAGVERGGGSANAGAGAIFSENDAGEYTGVREVLSPESTTDYALRIAFDVPLDEEYFNYSSQNTGKHTFTFTTLAATCTTTGITTNSGAITTINTGLTFGTFANFPCPGQNTLAAETTVAFTEQPTANTVVDFGLFLRGASTAFAPTDGVYFRLNSSGFLGVVNYGTSETTVSLTKDFGATGVTYVENTYHKYLIQTSNISTTFWIDNFLVGTIRTPASANLPFKSQSLPWSFRHAIVGGASGNATFKAIFSDYRVGFRGVGTIDTLGNIGNRKLGSYQGLSGGTMGSLSTYVNSTNPTAAVPSNTALTANLPAGFGGQAWETFTLALNVDGILLSQQVPVGSTSVQGRRLVIAGVKMTAFVQTVLAGGPCNSTFTLAYGHTAVSLATAETASMATATTKARRIVLLPELTQAITAAQAVNTMIAQPGGAVSMFQYPIYVNPGEFVQFCVKHVGTVGTSGTIAYNIQYVYGWE